MINAPATRYARSGDVRVAYQVTGSGSFDLVWAPGTVSHLDLDWELRPDRARVFRRLASFCRLIRFDKRGTGLSDRPPGAATLEERTDDIRAVMDAAASPEAAILGASEGAAMACLFAATYPERTRALLIWGGQARFLKSADYAWGFTNAEAERVIRTLEDNGVTAEYLTGPGAGLGNVSREAIEEGLRYARASASPGSIVALERMNAHIDIRDILSSIQVPTLVMNRTNDPVAHIDAARDLASRIPGAQFLEFPGDSHQMTGVEDAVVGEIEEFVTGSRGKAAADRVLASILFVDIVGSTQRAGQLGDAAWGDLLARHQTAVDRGVAEFSGVVVDHAGDGTFATFDGPGRAIRCALAIRAAATGHGLDVRAGIHTGEVEKQDRAVRGIAVHTAARIAGLAAAGEVLVSSTVKDLVAGSDIPFEDRGVHELKGIDAPRQLFAVQA